MPKIKHERMVKINTRIQPSVDEEVDEIVDDLRISKPDTFRLLISLGIKKYKEDLQN